MEKIITNEDMLSSIRNDRPLQVINKVQSFKFDKFLGFYIVEVDMETNFFNTRILHTIISLPYPLSEFEKLSDDQQAKWRWYNNSM